MPGNNTVHSSSWIIIAVALVMVAVFASPGYAAESTATLTVYCWNGTVNLSTDKVTYAVTDTANMTVNLTDYMDVSLNEFMVLDVYNSSGNQRNMASDAAVVSANSTNSTSYYNNFGSLSAGNYWIRVKLLNATYYPTENRTLVNCNGVPHIDDVNITLTSARPNPPTGVKIRLVDNSTGEVDVFWNLSNSSGIYNYIIYRITDYDTGFNFSSPYDTVSNTTTNYTDSGSPAYDEAYYIVRANSTGGVTDLNTVAVGKFNLKLYTGWNLIAFPLLLYNYSANNITYNAEDQDRLWRYDANDTGDPYKDTRYFAGFGWFGDYTQVQVDRGYWYDSQKSGYTTSPFNLTIVGQVATAIRTQKFYSSWNLMGIASVKDYDADTLFPSEVDQDRLWRYDANDTADPYKDTRYFDGFGWFGDFTQMQPGKGYWYDSKNTTTYTWTYAP